MRVLVCGGRDFTDRTAIYRELNRLHDESVDFGSDGITTLIYGDARGADRIAGDWARIRFIPVVTRPADWKKHGKAAGPIRNTLMIVQDKPDVVVAFPSNGTGTADMVKRAKIAGIKLIDLRHLAGEASPTSE